MSSKCNLKDTDGYPVNPPDIVMTESAGRIIIRIEEILDYLINEENLHPADDIFYNKFREVLDLYDLLQYDVLAASEINPVCKKGCNHCCCHWVEDVSSPEGAILGRYLKENHPDLIEQIISSFRDDADVFDSLCVSVEDKKPECYLSSDESDDPYDLILSYFYQLGRRCALLDKNDQCLVYPVRPFTCRDYFNVRDSSACYPERINNENNATLIVYFSDTITQKIEVLHRRFDDGSDDMSLRRLLVRFLE